MVQSMQTQRKSLWVGVNERSGFCVQSAVSSVLREVWGCEDGRASVE